MPKTKIAGFDRTQLLAPLVIGVTGHRDLRDEDRQHLHDRVKDIFRKLRQDYSETPLILISPLAEGADRLAAEAALSAHVGVRLIVPLPMPQDLYERDFDHVAESATAGAVPNKKSREEFRALLDKADTKFELDLAPGNTREAIATPGPARDRQYERVGQYIARQSQILIALWDGADSSRTGGTASVVHFQTEGVPGPEICELEAPDGFPVYHILTPRQKNPYPQGQVLSLRPIYPAVFQENHIQAEKYYRHMFGRLNEFNSFITHADHALAKQITKSKKYLLQDTREEELPAEMASAFNRYAVADALAIRFQKRWFSAQIVLHGLIFAAFLSFLLFADRPEHFLGFLFVSAALVFAALALKKLSGKLALDTQHEDYRAMAEGLRVKFFWRLAGITEPIADHYLGKQRSELDWIRNGFRGWNAAEGRQDHGKQEFLDENDQRNRLGFARKYWIDDQQDYFRRTAERNLKYHERIEWVGLVFMAGVLLVGVVLGFLRNPRYELYFEPLAIGLEVLLAAAAILHHFNNRMAFAEHAKQYQRMASLFAHGSDLLGKFLERHDYKHARQCVRNVGNEALSENGDWVLLHRERPLEVPHP